MKKLIKLKRYPSFLLKFDLKMKLTTLLLIVSLFQLQANEAYGQKEKITLDLENVSVESVLNRIEQLTEFKFLYNYSEVDYKKIVSVNAKKERISSILNKLFLNSNISFKILEKQIVLKTAKQLLSAVQHKVSGQVVDKDKMPIAGANIRIKGAKKGVVTNFDGGYSIITDEQATLVFSYLGYTSQEIKVEGRNKINVILQEDISKLDEVVVTGIVTRSKESFTGAVTTVKGEELRAIGNLNLVESLKTIDPSFIIFENRSLGSDPNNLPKIEVRGQTSISTDNLRDEFGNDPNQPLFILDGFETSLRIIVDLDINRIESVTILKDASSTALYGSNAANGVIVVETKKPKLGQLQISYSSDFRIEMPDLSDFNLMNASEKLEYERLSGYWDRGESTTASQFDRGKHYNAVLKEVTRGVDTYWLNEPLRVGTTLGHSLSASGGAEAFRYGVSLNYRKQEGLMIGSGRTTWGGNIRMNYRKGKLNISNNLSINGAESVDSPYGSFAAFSRANPYFRKTDENGNITKYLDIDGFFINNDLYLENPLYRSTLNNYSGGNSRNIANNLQAILSISNQFRIQANIQLSSGLNTSESFVSPQDPSFRNSIISERGRYTNTRTDRFTYRANVMTTYANVFAEKHRLTTNIRGSIEHSKNKLLGIGALGFPVGTNGNPAFAFDYLPESSPNTSERVDRRVNILGSLNYSYDNIYLFDATYRLDGSTVFGSSNKYSPFWSVGLGWNLHNQFNMSDKITMFKLRGNIGSTGNQGFAALNTVALYRFINDVNIFGQGAKLESIANPNLKWQNALDTSFGVDIAFKNRMSTTLNGFVRRSDPLVASINLPSSTGVFQYPINVGYLDTKGLEASIRFSPIYRPEQQLIWNLRLTVAATQSEYGGFGDFLRSLDDAGRAAITGASGGADILEAIENGTASRHLLRYRDGYSPSDMWALESLGIDPGNGREVFLTKDGETTYEYDIENEKVMGNNRPTIEGVFGTDFRLGNISLGLNFRYRMGGDVINSELYNKVENISQGQRIFNHDVRALTERWQQPGDIARFKAIDQFDNTRISSRFIQEENVLIAESFNMAYEFRDTQWVKNLGLSQLRLTAFMNDIFRISSIKTERGIRYPFARTISLKLNANF